MSVIARYFLVFAEEPAVVLPRGPHDLEVLASAALPLKRTSLEASPTTLLTQNPPRLRTAPLFFLVCALSFDPGTSP